MKTTKLQFTQKELRLLTDALYHRWRSETLDKKPESLASKLYTKLYDSKVKLQK